MDTKAGIWMSHRGICHNVVENTEASFDQAVASGFVCLETDLRTTADGMIVHLHDPDFQRLGGPSTPLAQLTAQEVQNIRLQDGQPPLTFERFMSKYAGYSWVFDIKPETGRATILALKVWLDEHKAHDWLVSQAYFLFWDRKQEELLLDFLPQARIFASLKECWRAGLSCLLGFDFLSGIQPGRWYAIPPQLYKINLFKPNLVARYHRKGAKTIAYLPQTEYQSRLAVKAGFDLILTNNTPI